MSRQVEARGGGGDTLRRALGARRTFECRIEQNSGAAAILEHLDAVGLIPFDHVAEIEGWFAVVLTEAEIAVVEEHGLVVERSGELVPRAERQEVRLPPSPLPDLAVDALGTGFVTGYLDAVEVAARISALAVEFPALCQLTTLPYPTTGYDGTAPGLAGPAAVQLLRITNAPAVHARPGFLLACGTHAREWINPLIAVEFAEQLLRNYDPTSTDPAIAQVNRIVDEGDVFVIPVLNPDGLNYSIHDDAGWRKNRRPNSGTPSCPGVDNNRNYEVYFGGAGSSAAPCDDSFHGAAAFSEPENQNLRWLLEQNPNILVGVDSHSFGQHVFRPNPSGGTYIGAEPISAADHALYTGLEAVLVPAIQAVNGISYSTGSTSNHAGTSDEFMFFAHRVFGFDLECALSFQPPVAGALAAVQEVVAGLRALAVATLDLDLTTSMPARVVQCLDRTGSMTAFGYEGPARANAKRLIDMMSLGDSVGVVSFADPSPDPTATPPANRATVELPLTAIDDPGDFATARTSIDGIAFGGWTPIGAGLQRSSDLLAGSPPPRAVVLLSDGFENRDPWTADVLAAFPPNLRIFTIALGGMADIGLLQTIASATGGFFYASPSTLDLHQIYNQIRADVTDDGLVLNDLVVADEDDGGIHAAEVEQAAERLLVTVSWNGRSRKPRVHLIAPSGRTVSTGDWGAQFRRSGEYILIDVLRPMPGRWLVMPERVGRAHTVGAIVVSPLQVRVHPVAGKDGLPQLAIQAAFDGRQLPPPHARAQSVRMATPTPDELASWRRRSVEWTDQLPHALEVTVKPRGRNHSPLWTQTTDSEHGTLLKHTLPATPGTSTARIRLDGSLSGGRRFVRTVLRTIVVADAS